MCRPPHPREQGQGDPGPADWVHVCPRNPQRPRTLGKEQHLKRVNNFWRTKMTFYLEATIKRLTFALKLTFVNTPTQGTHGSLEILIIPTLRLAKHD